MRNLKCSYCGGTGNTFFPWSNGVCDICKGFGRVTKDQLDAYNAKAHMAKIADAETAWQARNSGRETDTRKNR